jgi:sulfur-oxidizing protein SoxX
MVPQHHRRHVRLAAALVLALAGAAAAAERTVPFAVIEDGIPLALTAVPGDPRRGRDIAANSDRGNCLICHVLPIAEAPVFGDLGPTLARIGSRLTAAQIRLRIVDPKRVNPASIMPSFHRSEGLFRVAPAYAGQPILSAQDVEDLVAYLLTVTEP